MLIAIAELTGSPAVRRRVAGDGSTAAQPGAQCGHDLGGLAVRQLANAAGGGEVKSVTASTIPFHLDGLE
jgi:hypothetical protein